MHGRTREQIEELHQKLKALMRGADIPDHRKSQISSANYNWLEKNIGKYNKNHPKLAEIQNLLHFIITNKES